MAYLLGSAVATVLLTVLVAWRLGTGWPAGSRTAHVLLSAASFPALATLLFAIATFYTLVIAERPSEPGGTTGMVVFSMVFFLFYAVAIGVVIGLPTALLAVRAFRAA